MMKRFLALVTLSCVVALAFAPTVQGEEGAAAASADTWMFDVRLVRVDAATPEGVEQPAPWEATGSCQIDTPWSEVLGLLKARGKTTLLLDQRVTGLAGMESLIAQTRDRQIEQLQSRDLSNERWSVAPVVTGGMAKLKVAGPTLQYALEARWEIRSEIANVRPLLCTTKWQGTFPAHPGGGTLVLTYREQIDTWGEARVGTEIHAFVTMRRLAAR